MAYPVRATDVRRVNAHIPAETVERAIERVGMRFGDNMTTLIHAALLAVIDERVSDDVLKEARTRAPRKRGPKPRTQNADTIPA